MFTFSGKYDIIMVYKYTRKIHMKKRFCAIILAITLLASCAVGASAARQDITAVERHPDLAPTERQADLGIVAADYPQVGTDLEPDEALPSSYSNRALATPIRNQRFNTCWAYASTSVMEIAANKAGIFTGQFSPMHMNYWAVKRDDETGWQRTYYDAGYPYIAMGYLTSYSGVVKEEDFPQNMEYEDYQTSGKDLPAFIGASSLIYLKANDRDTVKTAVYNYGAAVGNFSYESQYYNYNTGAYCCDFEGLTTSQLRGHAITILGWDDDYSRENFNEDHRPDVDGAWLCKNSWGEGWSADGGYFWISYEDQYLFDKRFGPSYTIAGLEQFDENNRLYQNEEYGATCEFDYITEEQSSLVEANKEVTYVNVFDFSKGFNELDKIVFESTSSGSEYTLSLIPLDKDGVPVNDKAQWTTLGTGTIDYQGYLCIDIDNLTVPRGRAGIGVTVKQTENSTGMSIGACEWLTVGGGRSIFLPNAKKGDCYVIGYDKRPRDLMDLYYLWFEDTIGGTFVIKAITNKVDVIGDVDLDGEVSILDVTKIQRRIADIDTFSEYQEKLADYDADEVVSILDCTKIQRVLVGIEEPLYVVW